MGCKHIAAFDFDPGGRAALEQELSSYFCDSAHLHTFDDTQSVARELQKGGYDMAFMVVNGMPAMETARLVRESAPDIPLFLVSKTGDYALEGFRLHALDYLIQPLSSERISAAVARIGSPTLRRRTQCNDSFPSLLSNLQGSVTQY